MNHRQIHEAYFGAMRLGYDYLVIEAHYRQARQKVLSGLAAQVRQVRKELGLRCEYPQFYKFHDATVWETYV